MFEKRFTFFIIIILCLQGFSSQSRPQYLNGSKSMKISSPVALDEFEIAWSYALRKFEIDSNRFEKLNYAEVKHILDRVDEKIILRGDFFAVGLEKRVFLSIPSFDKSYVLYLNDNFIPLSFSHILGNKIDVTPFLQNGKNSIYLKIDPRFSKNELLSFSNRIQVKPIKNLYLSHFTSVAEYRTSVGAYGVPLRTKSGLRISYQVSNFSDLLHEVDLISELYYLNDFSDTLNYLSYEVNTTTYKENEQAFQRAPLQVSPGGIRGTVFLYVQNVKPWTGEKPALYSLQNYYWNSEGQAITKTSTNVGFRDFLTPGSVEWKQKNRVLGVSCVEQLSGGQNKLKTELSRLKQNNVNTLYVKLGAVTSNVLGICDSLGINVLLDVNISALFHSKYKASVEEVARRIYLSYSHHPSLQAWVLTDSVNNRNRIHQVYELISEMMNERKVPLPIMVRTNDLQYAKSFQSYNNLIVGVSDDNAFEEILTMPNPVVIFSQLSDKQKMNRYLKMMEYGYPQNLLGVVGQGQEIHSDSVGKYLRYKYQKIKIDWITNTSFLLSVKNEYFSTNLSEYDFRIELLENNVTIEEKAIKEVTLKPGQVKVFNSRLEYEFVPAKEYELRILVKLKEDKPWANTGHIVAKENFYFMKDQYGDLHKISRTPLF